MSTRRHASHDHPVFIAVDRFGLPLEDAVQCAIRRGWTADLAFFDFLLGAAHAGWSRKKVQADVREAIRDIAQSGTVDARLVQWADASPTNPTT